MCTFWSTDSLLTPLFATAESPTCHTQTTFLSQQSIDLAEQGINVLWGSFEIKNSRLIKKLLQQFAREPLVIEENDQKLDAIADRFEQLPLHFMKFHGGTDVDDVLDAMDYAGEPYPR